MEALFCDREGEASRAPVVLLHGFGGHHGIWRDVRARLGPDIPTIAYDLPGHGRSLAARDAASPRRAADAILEDLAGRQVTSFHLVGHSMGGAIATLMAISDPGRIASLTLLAPGGFGETINEPALRALAAASSEAELAGALGQMYASDHRPKPEDLAAHARIRAQAGQIPFLGELVSRIARDGRQGVIPREAIGRLTMPIAVVWGEEDAVLSPGHADGLPAHFAVHRLAGAGHMLPEECPGAVADLIKAQVAG